MRFSILHRLRPVVKDALLVSALSMLLLVVCYLRLLGDAQSAAFNPTTVDPQLLKLHGTALGKNLLSFAVAQVILHLLFGLACLSAAQLSVYSWPKVVLSRRQWMMLWFIGATTWLLVANATWFPLSSLGQTYDAIGSAAWHGVGWLQFITILYAVPIVATVWRTLARFGIDQALKPISLVSLLILLGWASIGSVPTSKAVSAARHPNVILLGMDSLRADAIGRGRTPNIDAFLERSVVFSDTLTPIARTFPAWVSIITGRHPHTTGAIVNLMPRELIDAGETLPMLLREQGYTSLYAIDDARFSNLDASFGFDHVITPPMGATDFVLGFFSDTPLSNIVTDTALGALLFPFAHANRASALTYDPNTFVAKLGAQLPKQRPLLVATHFTLAHPPYVWSGQQYAPRRADGTLALDVLYDRAVAGLDEQFAAYVAMLRAKGVLDDAIVVVFSDHGESLGEHCHASASADCRLYGHGTSVMAQEQYRVVLGIRSFQDGHTASAPTGRRVLVPTSLEDITPTIADLLHLPNRPYTDGRSLAGVLWDDPGAAERFAHRVRFVETGFNPKGFDGRAMANAAALRRASSYYLVNAQSDRLTLRENEMPGIKRDRQRGAWRDGNLLVAIPDDNGDFHLLYRGVDLPEQKFAEPGGLGNPIALELWSGLRQRFPELVEQRRSSEHTLLDPPLAAH